MKNKFQIEYKNKKVQAEMQHETLDKKFTVYISSNRIVTLLKAEDSDGANRWFDAEKNAPTEESKELGIAIEKYMAENKDD